MKVDLVKGFIVDGSKVKQGWILELPRVTDGIFNETKRFFTEDGETYEESSWRSSMFLNEIDALKAAKKYVKERRERIQEDIEKLKMELENLDR